MSNQVKNDLFVCKMIKKLKYYAFTARRDCGMRARNVLIGGTPVLSFFRSESSAWPTRHGLAIP